jgi:hypothetical protein
MSIALARTTGSHSLSFSVVNLAPYRGEFPSNRFQIITRVKTVGDGANILTERLAVAQKSRARQNIDLRARIVDVVLARYIVAGERQQVGERIAEHCATAVTDMHGPGRVGRDILDVDLFAFADSALSVVFALLKHKQ